MAMTTAEVSRANGHRADPAKVTGGRDRRLPFVALGVVLVLGGALVSGLMVQSAGERTAVLAAAGPIAQGQVIAADDLKVVEVAVADGVAVVPATHRSALVGQVAAAPVAEGTLLAPGQVSPDGGLPDGTVVVGALLGPGQLPVANLQPGQRVRMLTTAGSAQPALGEASVFATSPGTQTGSVFVSLAVDDGVADDVALAVAAQGLSLILMSAGD